MGQKSFDQIRSDQPLASIDGSEVFLVQKAGVTKGGLLSALKTWVLTAFSINNVNDATAVGKAVVVATDAAAARVAIGAGAALTGINQADAEAGTATTLQNFSALRVAQAIRATVSTPTLNGTAKQGVAVANATGSGDVVAQVNALLTSLRTAGLIAT